jgi:DNA-3-methyladenine glycosylase II
MPYDTNKALEFLKQSDTVMSQLIAQHAAPAWREQHHIDLFTDVVESIVSQQLSVKVADVITARLYNLLPDKSIAPAAILSLDVEAMRACGLSYAKIKYMKSAAEAAETGSVDFDNLPHKTDQEVIAELITIHGVGKWTAEMLLIFSLQRPDVFSVGDLGLRTAVARLYGVDRANRAAIETIAARWSPYRSLASRYLWKSLDNEPK